MKGSIEMKRLVATLVLAGVMVGISSCAFKGEGSVSDNETSNKAQAVVTDAVKDDRAKLCELPEEANGAFNTIINTVKKICPLEKGMNRQYGYKGLEKVGDADCYLFSVYDFDEDNSSVKVGDFAKAVEGEMIYKLVGSNYEQVELGDEEPAALTLSDNSNASKKMLKNAATLAAEKVLES